MDYNENTNNGGNGETKIALHLVQHLRDPCVSCGGGCATQRFYQQLAKEFWKSAVNSCARGIVELELRDHKG